MKRVFIGLENINPGHAAGREASDRTKSPITAQMLLAWKKAGVVTYCGYILGFPGDTQESILRDIEIIKKELPVDLLEFFYLTPLPGSEDHKKLHEAGIEMDADLNKYDLNHAVTAHPKMSQGKLGRNLPKSVENLLHRRAYRNRSAPRHRDRHESGQDDVFYHMV